jgi:hypothetical protein
MTIDLDAFFTPWKDAPCWVCATGPSLGEYASIVQEEAHNVGGKIITVNNAYRLVRGDVMFGSERVWWQAHAAKTQSHPMRLGVHQKQKHEVMLVQGVYYLPGSIIPLWCRDPWMISAAGGGGFSAVNLALHTGANPIFLIGFEGHDRKGQHFWNIQTSRLRYGDGQLSHSVKSFRDAVADWPEAVERIRNITPDSDLPL